MSKTSLSLCPLLLRHLHFLPWSDDPLLDRSVQEIAKQIVMQADADQPDHDQTVREKCICPKKAAQQAQQSCGLAAPAPDGSHSVRVFQGDSRTVGIITEDLTAFNTQEIVDGIASVCEAHRYHYLLTDLRFNKRYSDSPWDHPECSDLVRTHRRGADARRQPRHPHAEGRGRASGILQQQYSHLLGRQAPGKRAISPPAAAMQPSPAQRLRATASIDKGAQTAFSTKCILIFC